MKRLIATSIIFLIACLLPLLAQSMEQTGQLAIGQLHIEKNANSLDLHLESLKLVNTNKIVSNEQDSPAVEGHIIGIIVDQFNKPIDTLWLGNPTFQRLEYPTGAGGELATITQENAHADVLLRFRYKPEMKAIQFQQVKAEKLFENLTIIPIQLR
jgi:hypothetical protein